MESLTFLLFIFARLIVILCSMLQNLVVFFQVRQNAWPNKAPTHWSHDSLFGLNCKIKRKKVSPRAVVFG